MMDGMEEAMMSGELYQSLHTQPEVMVQSFFSII
jgi:hypothetical protein